MTEDTKTIQKKPKVITKIAQKKPKTLAKTTQKKSKATTMEKILSPEKQLIQNVKKMHFSQTGLMVLNALVTLKEHKGASMAKIRNFIAGHFQMNVKALNYRTKQFVKDSLENGILVAISDSGTKATRVKIPGFLLVTIRKKVQNPLPAVQKKTSKPKSSEAEQQENTVATSEEPKKKKTATTKKGTKKAPNKEAKAKKPKAKKIASDTSSDVQAQNKKMATKSPKENAEKIIKKKAAKPKQQAEMSAKNKVAKVPKKKADKLTKE